MPERVNLIPCRQTVTTSGDPRLGPVPASLSKPASKSQAAPLANLLFPLNDLPDVPDTFYFTPSVRIYPFYATKYLSSDLPARKCCLRERDPSGIPIYRESDHREQGRGSDRTKRLRQPSFFLGPPHCRPATMAYALSYNQVCNHGPVPHTQVPTVFRRPSPRH